jgi:hypothetical protein
MFNDLKSETELVLISGHRGLRELQRRADHHGLLSTYGWVEHSAPL